MRRTVLMGSIATTIAAGYATLVLAAAIMNPLAGKQTNGDVLVNWGPSGKAGVASYEIQECKYAGQKNGTCLVISETLHNPQFTDYSATIAASSVLTDTNAVVKVIALDVAGVELERDTSNKFNVGSVAPTTGPGSTPVPTTPPVSGGSTTTIELAAGCQQNIAVGQFPADAMKAIADAGGSAQIENVGVYQLTLKKVGLHEDDARLQDVRDFENECKVTLALVQR